MKKSILTLTLLCLSSLAQADSVLLAPGVQGHVWENAVRFSRANCKLIKGDGNAFISAKDSWGGPDAIAGLGATQKTFRIYEKLSDRDQNKYGAALIAELRRRGICR